MAKFVVTYGTAGVPARFWNKVTLDDTNPKEKEQLDQARREKRPIQPVE